MCALRGASASGADFTADLVEREMGRAPTTAPQGTRKNFLAGRARLDSSNDDREQGPARSIRRQFGADFFSRRAPRGWMTGRDS